MKIKVAKGTYLVPMKSDTTEKIKKQMLATAAECRSVGHVDCNCQINAVDLMMFKAGKRLSFSNFKTNRQI